MLLRLSLPRVISLEGLLVLVEALVRASPAADSPDAAGLSVVGAPRPAPS